MQESNQTVATIPVPGRDVLTEILRDGAQRLLGQAIEAEVDGWIEGHADLHDPQGHQQVVKNGHHPARTLITGVGPVEVSQPRVLESPRRPKMRTVRTWTPRAGRWSDSIRRSCRRTCGRRRPSRS